MRFFSRGPLIVAACGLLVSQIAWAALSHSADDRLGGSIGWMFEGHDPNATRGWADVAKLDAATPVVVAIPVNSTAIRATAIRDSLISERISKSPPLDDQPRALREPGTLELAAEVGESLPPAVCVAAAASVATSATTLPERVVPDERALRDIQEIRREQGGLFKGTLLEELAAPTSDEDFLEALRSVAVKSSSAVVPASNTARVDAPSLAPLLKQPAFVAPADAQLVRTLRATAKQLDDRAVVFEASRQYKRADQLRSLARKLRKQARKLPYR